GRCRQLSRGGNLKVPASCVESSSSSLNCEKPRTFECEVHRIARALEASFCKVKTGAIQSRELIDEPAPAVGGRRALRFDQERLERRYLSSVAGCIYVRNIVRHQLQSVRLRLQGRACRVVTAVHT